MRPISSPYVSRHPRTRFERATGQPGIPTLDDWIPEPAVRTHLSRSADATPEQLWQAAETVKLSDTRTLGHLVRWRIPGLEQDQTFWDLLRTYPFTLLDEGPHWTISGICGRIWTKATDYPELRGGDDFRAWDEPGTVRVIFGHWVREAGAGRAELVSEERIEALDAQAARRLRALWRVVGPFQDVIAAEPLPVAVRRAERNTGLQG
ncbi:MAG: hypothetical protein M3P40_07740 [Actinomycetota bacterium]|nr:hypothetical protein [Actinomycetota bacterium]